MNEVTLILNDRGGVSRGVLRISKPGTKLTIVIKVGSAFHEKDTIIFTNHPGKDGKEQYVKQTGKYDTLTDMQFEISILHSGVYVMYCKNGENEGSEINYIVDPVIYIRGKEIPLEKLQIQTNIPFCIGTLDKWVDNLKPISDLGYNMIHLPPIQIPGLTSCYSLGDPCNLSDELFNGKHSNSEKWAIMELVSQELENRLGIGLMIDVVLNHLNNQSQLIYQHPDVAYTTKNSPYLEPAFQIDQTIYDLSCDINAGKVPGLTSNMNETHLAHLTDVLYERLRSINLQKYFIINLESSLSQILEYEPFDYLSFKNLQQKAKTWSVDDRRKYFIENGAGAHNINLFVASALYKDDSQIDELNDAISAVNSTVDSFVDSIIHDVVTSTINEFKASKFHHVSSNYPLATRYFKVTQTVQGETRIANNGWTQVGNPTQDFMSPHSEILLRRQLGCWGDCAKLRYGLSRKENPFLWDLMSDYVRSVARVCKAIRLDNSHSTPPHVTAYYIKEAHKINPDIFIMAELFTSSDDESIDYVNKVGINTFLKEGCWNIDTYKMAALLGSSGGSPIASIDSINGIITPTKQIPAVVYDCTHDNPVPDYNRFLLASVTSMFCGPIASTRGYDDYMTINPSVVNERRIYPTKENRALQMIRKELNELHMTMADEKMTEFSAVPINNDFLSLIRANSSNGCGYWMIARFNNSQTLEEIKAPFPVSQLVFEGSLLDVRGQGEFCTARCSYHLVREFEEMRFVQLIDENDAVKIQNFPVGGVIVFKIRFQQKHFDAMNDLSMDSLVSTLMPLFAYADLYDLAELLYTSDPEEHEKYNRSTYEFPYFGKCFFSGIKGFVAMFDSAAHSPYGMNSSVFSNMRDGDWVINYCITRIAAINSLIPVATRITFIKDKILMFPRYLMPRLVDRLIRAIDFVATQRVISLMSPFVQASKEFTQKVAQTTIMFSVPNKKSPLIKESILGQCKSLVKRWDCSTAAGLPHFSCGFMRSWGRDTFIALRGLYLVTGRFNIARDHLVAFASCLNHGLIPNLHNGADCPRYNSRDATWWFLQALQDYALTSGENVFNWQVPLVFQNNKVVTMKDIVLGIMTKHANGIHFRDDGADDCMTEQGRKIDIEADWSTGFIHGGNKFNCGTWMDKMGSSSARRGVPATPRDGAPIELTGLLASTLRWLSSCNEKGTLDAEGVQVESQGGLIKWSAWKDLILDNFEQWYYIPGNKNHDGMYHVDKSQILVRSVYKDTVGSGPNDYQFRPNVVIAMTVAPELFDPAHAVKTITLIEQRLLGPMGIATLDPCDLHYRKFYSNGESDDPESSNGFSYHNGPEWLWPTGYLIRASLRFRRPLSEQLRVTISHMVKEFEQNPALGLPELTNANGEFCYESCKSQAWSVSCLMDALYDLSVAEKSMEPYDWDHEAFSDEE